MLAAGLIALAPQAAQAAEGLRTYEYTPLAQTWNVPANVREVTVHVRGAGGGQGGKEGGVGGRGDEGSFVLQVSPGGSLTFGIGERGENADADNQLGNGGGGFHILDRDGGDGGNGDNGGTITNGGAGGGGGAATSVRYTPAGPGATPNTVIVAAGGGGGGGQSGDKLKGGAGGDAGTVGGWGETDLGASNVLGGDPGASDGNDGGQGDDAQGNVGGGGAGGGGGGAQGGSGGDTIGNSGGAGGGGGISYFDPQRVTPVDPGNAWTPNVAGNGSIRLSWSYTTGIAISDPNTVVTGQAKGYTVSLGATGSEQELEGTIDFSIENLATGDTTPVQTKPVTAGGSATFFESGLKVGNYRISAKFTADSGSGSLDAQTTRTFAVTKGDSKTLVAGPAVPPKLGESVDLGVSVTPVDPAQGIPSGQVRFFADGDPIPGGLVTLDAFGKAVLTTSQLPVGNGYNIVARYLGDSEFTNSQDALNGFAVNQGDVDVALTSVFNPVIAGQQAVFDVKVTPNAPATANLTGDVRLLVNGSSVDVKPIRNDGTQRFSIDLDVNNPAAPYVVTAVYFGDPNYVNARSNDVLQVVNAGEAKVRLTSDLNPSRVNQPVTFSVDVDGVQPTSSPLTGQVQLYVNGTPFNAPFGIDPVTGTADVAIDTLPVGTNTVTATYLGDDDRDAATSAPLLQVVNKQLVAVTLTANDTQLQYGEKLTLAAKVATEKGDLATGLVQFYDNGTAVGAPALLDGTGVARISSEQVSKGVHQYSARYLGDAKNPEGVSNTIEVSVLKNTLSFTLITNRVPAYERDDILLHARLQADAGSVGKIAGVVQYYTDGNAYGAPVPVNGNNWASLVVRKPKVGMHRFTAKFIPAADSPFETNTAGGVIQRVLKGKPNASVRMSVKRTGPSTATLKVRVRKTKGGAAHGYVQLYINGAPTQLVKLPSGDGTKTVSLSGLPSGTVFVTANYRPRGSTKQAGKSVTLR